MAELDPSSRLPDLSDDSAHRGREGPGIGPKTPGRGPRLRGHREDTGPASQGSDKAPQGLWPHGEQTAPEDQTPAPWAPVKQAGASRAAHWLPNTLLLQAGAAGLAQQPEPILPPFLPPSHSPHAPSTAVLLRPSQKCMHSQKMARKHTQRHRIYPQSAVVLTQERAFYCFLNSLPEKLTFKTLLRSLLIACATFKSEANPNPRRWGQRTPRPGCDPATEAGLPLELCQGESDGQRPLETPPAGPQRRDAQKQRAGR